MASSQSLWVLPRSWQIYTLYLSKKYQRLAKRLLILRHLLTRGWSSAHFLGSGFPLGSITYFSKMPKNVSEYIYVRTLIRSLCFYKNSVTCVEKNLSRKYYNAFALTEPVYTMKRLFHSSFLKKIRYNVTPSPSK